MWRSTLHVFRDLALLLARLATAAVLFMHGWQRWSGGIDKQTQWLAGHGIPTPGAFAWALTVFELAGAVFLVFGALVPVIGLVMVVAAALMTAWITWKSGFWATNGGYELQLLLGALGLIFLFFGGGRAAVDNLLKREKDDVDVTVADVNDYPSTPSRTSSRTTGATSTKSV